MVLYGLPTKDLLLAQGVCTYWKDLIDGSSKLQRALFFKNVFDEPVKLPTYINDDYKLVFKPGAKFVINPLLRPMLNRLTNRGGGDDDEVPGIGVHREVRAHLRTSLPASWFTPGASWRKMLLMQPVTKGFMTVYRFCSRVELEDLEIEAATDPKIQAWLAKYTRCFLDHWVRPDGTRLHTITHDQESLGGTIDCVDALLRTMPNSFETVSVTAKLAGSRYRCYELKDNIEIEEIRMAKVEFDGYQKALQETHCLYMARKWCDEKHCFCAEDYTEDGEESERNGEHAHVEEVHSEEEAMENGEGE